MRLTIAPVRRLVGEAVGLYWDSGVANDVPALAWFLLVSLVPLALGLTALAALVLGDYAKAQTLAERVSRILPSNVHEQVVQLILRTHNNSPLLIVGSILGMVWTSSSAVGVLERCAARLVGRPGAGVVVGKLRNIAIAAAVAFLIVLTVAVASVGTGIVRELGLDSTATRILLPIVSTAVTALICAGVYWVIGGGHVRWRAALAGGVVGGILLQVTPTLAGYYLRYVAGNTPVELFLMLSGVLATCYLVALALLLGVGVSVRRQVGHRLGDDSGAGARG